MNFFDEHNYSWTNKEEEVDNADNAYLEDVEEEEIFIKAESPSGSEMDEFIEFKENGPDTDPLDLQVPVNKREEVMLKVSDSDPDVKINNFEDSDKDKNLSMLRKSCILQTCISLLDSSSDDDDELMLLYALYKDRREKGMQVICNNVNNNRSKK